MAESGPGGISPRQAVLPSWGGSTCGLPSGRGSTQGPFTIQAALLGVVLNRVVYVVRGGACVDAALSALHSGVLMVWEGHEQLDLLQALRLNLAAGSACHLKVLSYLSQCRNAGVHVYL